MTTINIQLWLYELLLSGGAAILFAILVLPLVYWFGARDGRRVGRTQGITLGYNRACVLMGVSHTRDGFPHLSTAEVEEVVGSKRKDETWPS